MDDSREEVAIQRMIAWAAHSDVGRFRSSNEDAFIAIKVTGEGVYRLGKWGHDSNLEGEVQIGKMTSLSAFGGFLSSVMAIGAGMIYVPAMKFFGNLETRRSIGSSLNIMMVVLPFAIVAHFMLLNDYQISQLIDESILLIVLIIANFSGSKFGAILGFRLFDESILMKLFIGVLSITWINYVIDLAI